MTDKVIPITGTTQLGKVVSISGKPLPAPAVPLPSIAEFLERVAGDVRIGKIAATKVAVLLIDDDGEKYNISQSALGLPLNELVTLYEFGKFTTLKAMVRES